MAKKKKKAAAKKKKPAKKAAKKKPAKKVAKKKAKKPAKKNTSATNAVRSDNRKYLIFIGLVVAGVLLIAVLVLANRTEDARNDATNTGQDELLKVRPGDPESLQPNGSDTTNPQQSSPSPQGDGGAANEIQPQTSVTPEQQEQIQQ